jgi:transmembrane sensor
MDEDKLIAYITGAITGENEKAEVREWINRDHANKQLFIQLKNTYALSRKDSGTTDVDQEYLKLQRNAGYRTKRLLTELIKYAAVVIITLGLTWFVQDKYENKTETGLMNEVICPPGQISELVLSDGSHVWLNSGSTISYPSHFSGQQRSVRLEGEAFFEVTANKKNPFLVKTPTMNIKVLGTSFNVDAYGENQFVRTTLVEGKVELQSKTGVKIAEMLPGQLANFNTDNQQLDLSEVDTRFYSSWKEGKMTFFNEPLGVIAAKLERWYNVKFTFAQEDIRSYRFSGTFLKYKPLEQILEIIKLSSPIDYKITIHPEDKNEIILTKLNRNAYD